MSDGVVALALVALSIVTALNLLLLLRLAGRPAADGKGQAQDGDKASATIPLGLPLPTFAGRLRTDGRMVGSTDLELGAAVLLFLSSGCPRCRQTLPGLLDMFPRAGHTGVALWLLAEEPGDDLANLVGTTPLLDRLLVLSRTAYVSLNPVRAVPSYIFVDGAGVVVASGYIGDADWLSFVDQLARADGQPSE